MAGQGLFAAGGFEVAKRDADGADLGGQLPAFGCPLVMVQVPRPAAADRLVHQVVPEPAHGRREMAGELG